MPLLTLVLAVGSVGIAMSTDLAGSEWRPSHVSSSDLPLQTKIFIQFKADGQLTGYGGCNRFFAPYTTSGNTIEIGLLASTRKGCPGTLDLEIAFFTAL